MGGNFRRIQGGEPILSEPTSDTSTNMKRGHELLEEAILVMENGSNQDNKPTGDTTERGFVSRSKSAFNFDAIASKPSASIASNAVASNALVGQSTARSRVLRAFGKTAQIPTSETFLNDVGKQAYSVGTVEPLGEGDTTSSEWPLHGSANRLEQVERDTNSEAKTKVYAKTAATQVEMNTIPETVLPHREVSSAAIEEASRPQEIAFQPEECVKQNTDSSSAVTGYEMRIRRKQQKFGNKLEAGKRGNGTNGSACSKWFESLSPLQPAHPARFWAGCANDPNRVIPAMTPCQQARVLFRVLQILMLDLHRRIKRRVIGQDIVTLEGLGRVSAAAHTSLLSLFEAVVGIAALLGYALKDNVRRLLMRSTSRSRLVMRMVLLAATGGCACRSYCKSVMTSNLQKDFLRLLERACYRHTIPPWRNCSLCQGDCCRQLCCP